jgi:hypothetical protein
MPSLGAGLGLPWGGAVKRFDPDALAYVATSGAASESLFEISAFVKGVKKLGLWNNMVCWPLRSSQNSSSGNTLYSLGGLGVLNATMVNSPTRSANGMVFDATNKRIDVPNNADIYNSRSAFFVFKSASTGITQALINIEAFATSGYYARLLYDGNNDNGFRGLRYEITRNGDLSRNSAVRTATTDFVSAAFTADDATDNVFRNGAIETSGARTGLSAINPTGTREFRAIYWNSNNMTAAFAMTSTQKWSNTQVAKLHALYKSTLGNGLGLP